MKNEDEVAVMAPAASLMKAQKINCGWVLKQVVDPMTLTPEQVALMGQTAKRVPGMMVWGETMTGEKVEQTYWLTNVATADLMMEVILTFGNRTIWQKLMQMVPEEWRS
jgi:hypothetical protein